jgi:hypothetical protein
MHKENLETQRLEAEAARARTKLDTGESEFGHTVNQDIIAKDEIEFLLRHIKAPSKSITAMAQDTEAICV